MVPDLTAWAHDLQAGCLAYAAQVRGIPWTTIMAHQTPEGPPVPWLHFVIGGRAYFYRQALLVSAPDPRDGRTFYNVNRRAAELIIDKHVTKRVLSALGIPVPAGQVFGAADSADARAMFDKMSRPACVKPNRGERGIAVYPRLLDPLAFAAAFEAAGRVSDQLVVEEHLEGEAVRFLYIRPLVVGVRLGRPAHVIGDGRRSVAELVDARNDERRRRALPGTTSIALDAEAHRFLALEGLVLASVPAAGRSVPLRGTSNMASGAESIDCRSALHPSHSRLVAEYCSRISDLRLAAVDTVIESLGAPAAPGNHWVLEINSGPDVVAFYFPWEGEPQDVAGALIDRLSSEIW